MTSHRLTPAALLLLATSLLAADPATVKPTASGGKKAAQSVQPPADPASGWTFSAGAQWRQLGSVNWQTGSAATRPGRPGSAPTFFSGSSTAENPGSYGPNGIGDHTYSDGYVKADGGTATFGDTWYWGYNNASQLQGTGPNQTLQFNSSSSSTTTTTTRSSSSTGSVSSSLKDVLSWDSDLSGAGWFAKIESPEFFRTKNLSLSAELGYSFAGAGTTHLTGGVFQARVQSVQRNSSSTVANTTTTQVTDTYDASGAVVPLAPYAGTLAGPGPLTQNAPSSRQSSTSNSSERLGGSSSTLVRTTDYFSDVREAFHMDLHTISLGPDLNAQFGRFRLGLGLGFGLNIADWDASFEERLSVRTGSGSKVIKTWRDETNGTEVLPGLYLQTTVEVQLTQRLSLFGQARYDWAESFRSGVGPSHFNAEVQGWTLGGGISFSF
jgi:hypothetical protein